MTGTKDRDYVGTKDKQQVGSMYWKDPVQTIGDLPVSDDDGACRVVRADESIYQYDATTTTWIKVAGEGVGDMLKTVYDPNDDGIVKGADELKPNNGTNRLYWDGSRFVTLQNFRVGANDATARSVELFADVTIGSASNPRTLQIDGQFIVVPHPAATAAVVVRDAANAKTILSVFETDPIGYWGATGSYIRGPDTDGNSLVVYSPEGGYLALVGPPRTSDGKYGTINIESSGSGTYDDRGAINFVVGYSGISFLNTAGLPWVDCDMAFDLTVSADAIPGAFALMKLEQNAINPSDPCPVLLLKQRDVDVESLIIKSGADADIFTFDETDGLKVTKQIQFSPDQEVFFDGATRSKSIMWDSVSLRFEINDDLDVGGDLSTSLGGVGNNIGVSGDVGGNPDVGSHVSDSSIHGAGQAIIVEATDWILYGTGASLYRWWSSDGIQSYTHIGTGTAQTGIFRNQFVLPANFTGFPATPLAIWIRQSDKTNALTVTMYKNGVADSTINGVSIAAIANDTWEQKTLTPGSTYAAGDRVTIEVTSVADLAETNDIATAKLEVS